MISGSCGSTFQKSTNIYLKGSIFHHQIGSRHRQHKSIAVSLVPMISFLNHPQSRNKMFKLFRRSKKSIKPKPRPERLPSLDDMINNLLPPCEASQRSYEVQVSEVYLASPCPAYDKVEKQVEEEKPPPPPRRKGHRISSTATIGLDRAFSQVRDFLSNEEVGVVGIYGMGGVGKTTLMKRIHQEFLVHEGYHVIWITLSKIINVDRIQKILMKELKLHFDPDEEPYNRAQQIGRKLELEDRKVALLLDDIWEVLDLDEVVGPIDFDTSLFKLVFTTRSEGVCYQMRPDREVKMKCLMGDDAWDLFEKSVGRKTLHESDPNILDFAVNIAEECKGLPLALVVIGRAMTCKYTMEEWKSALETLRKSPADYTEKNMFSRLRISFDMLPNNVMKDCFLHCCSFPEDKYMLKEELVEFWIGEGLLDMDGSLEKAYNKGFEIIGTLEAACLLEKEDQRGVKIHDVIRDMGLWIISDTNLNFVHDRDLTFSEEQITERWRKARRVYVLDGCKLPEKPDCHDLLALNVTFDHGYIPKVSNGFFEPMQGIRVLHLYGIEFLDIPVAIGTLVELRYLSISCSNLVRLPQEIGNLGKLMVLCLRDNWLLRELPSTIGQLGELRKLTFNTGPKELPIGFADLNKLEIIEFRGYIGKIPPSSFTKMTVLRNLILEVNSFNTLPADLWDSTSLEKLSISCKGVLKVSDDHSHCIGRLSGLKSLRLAKCPFSNGDKLLLVLDQMEKLTDLNIEDLPLEEFAVLTKRSLSHLTKLEMQWCSKLVELRIGEMVLHNLHTMFIADCRSLKHIYGLGNLHSLVELKVHRCSIEGELISEGEEFPNLKMLEVKDLRGISSICADFVLFPSLVEFTLSSCPAIKRLPRGLMMEKRSFKSCVIKGKQEWWNGLSWKDEDFKNFLLPHFTMTRY